MREAVLNVEGVYARYGLGDVLRGISLEAGQGEVVSLFGRNGVGKTTLLKTIAGWLKPHKGTIRLGGKTLSGLDPDRICHAGVGLVPEDRRIFPGLSVDENMRLGFRQTPDASAAQRLERLENAYQRFPRLRERRRQMGVTLSGGEQQMLAIARAQIADPALLILDEPSEGLAPIIVDEVRDTLAGVKKGGTSILLVEQNVAMALSLADRVVVLSQGQVQFTGTPEELEAQPDIKETYLGIA